MANLEELFQGHHTNVHETLLAFMIDFFDGFIGEEWFHYLQEAIY